jgi:hypothetical protein
VIGAIALGPVFLKIGDAIGLAFGAAAIAYFLVGIVIVPLLTFAASRLRFLLWQLAVLSLTVSVIQDNLRSSAAMNSSCGTARLFSS